MKDTLKNGYGYWMRFADAESLGLFGVPTKKQTIPVKAGWNLVGSVGSAISVSSITSDPPGMVTSNFFGYAGGYSTSDSIRPGKGHWVKVYQDGKLILFQK